MHAINKQLQTQTWESNHKYMQLLRWLFCVTVTVS